MSNEDEHTLIGYANLAVFLTKAGFPVTKSTLNRLGAEHRGPPVHGTWSNSYTFRPSDALQWARERSQQPRTPRGRKFAKPKPAAAAPVQVAKNDPPPPVAVTTPAPKNVVEQAPLPRSPWRQVEQLPPPPPPAPVVAASPPPQLGGALPPSNGRRA